MSKIGLAVLGYSRPDYLKQCLESLNLHNWGGATDRILILDFKDEETKKKNMIVAIEAGVNNVIYFTENRGVGKAKNEALKRMLNADCDHLFLMEDDILMMRNDTCQFYIDYAKQTGLEHLNFAHHGPGNFNKQATVTYKGKEINVHPHCIGAFSYYTRNALEKVGLIDEKFYNAFEHVEHSKRLIDAGFYTPFWFFADALGSENYLQEIPGSIDYSSIRPRSDWRSNIEAGKNYWIQKYGTWLPPYPGEFWK